MAPQNDILLCASCVKGNPVSPPEAKALVPTGTTPQCASWERPSSSQETGSGQGAGEVQVALARVHHAHALPPAAALRASVPVSPEHSGAAASRTPAPAPPAPLRHPPPSSTCSGPPPRPATSGAGCLATAGGRSHSVTPTLFGRGRSRSVFARFLPAPSPHQPVCSHPRVPGRRARRVLPF